MIMRTINYIKLLLVALPATWLASCSDVNVDDNYYTASHVTAAGYLGTHEDQFSEFIQILKESNYYALLSTYGNFTLFAPNNKAVDTYLKEHHYAAVGDIPTDVKDTLARTHIIKDMAYFSPDFPDGSLANTNMLDRYIVLSCDSDVNNNNALIYRVNKKAEIVMKDDSVTNGVVHVINNVLTASNLFLPDLIKQDPKCQLFAKALALTAMDKQIDKYRDDTYSVSEDSITKGVFVHYGGNDEYAYYPRYRYFKYTAFVEPDSILKNVYNISTMEELEKKAKEIYDASFPEDAGKYDNDYTNEKNPLHRWVAYHLIDRYGGYENWCSSSTIINEHWATKLSDPEDFFPTMCPQTLVRFCKPSAGLFINRKGLANNYEAGCRGVKVLTPSESGLNDQEALNGVYHYIDRMMAFDTNTKENVLNCRIRIDGECMSADFMNSGARKPYDVVKPLTGFKNGYIKDWKVNNNNTFIAVRCESPYYNSYEGNAMCIKGIYDVSIKLPPVPKAGTYEIRMGYTMGVERGVVQCYINNEPCGIPVDLRMGITDPSIGGVADTEDEDQNRANDKSLRNHGYMRAMDSYLNGEESMRSHDWCLRRILTTREMNPNTDYYLRLRQVLEDPSCYLSFDYIEIVPKSVYANPTTPENTH